jgi:hypothetical protein
VWKLKYFFLRDRLFIFASFNPCDRERRNFVDPGLELREVDRRPIDRVFALVP